MEMREAGQSSPHANMTVAGSTCWAGVSCPSEPWLTDMLKRDRVHVTLLSPSSTGELLSS